MFFFQALKIWTVHPAGSHLSKSLPHGLMFIILLVRIYWFLYLFLEQFQHLSTMEKFLRISVKIIYKDFYYCKLRFRRFLKFFSLLLHNIALFINFCSLLFLYYYYYLLFFAIWSIIIPFLMNCVWKVDSGPARGMQRLLSILQI